MEDAVKEEQARQEESESAVTEDIVSDLEERQAEIDNTIEDITLDNGVILEKTKTSAGVNKYICDVASEPTTAKDKKQFDDTIRSFVKENDGEYVFRTKEAIYTYHINSSRVVEQRIQRGDYSTVARNNFDVNIRTVYEYDKKEQTNSYSTQAPTGQFYLFTKEPKPKNKKVNIGKFTFEVVHRANNAPVVYRFVSSHDLYSNWNPDEPKTEEMIKNEEALEEFRKTHDGIYIETFNEYFTDMVDGKPIKKVDRNKFIKRVEGGKKVSEIHVVNGVATERNYYNYDTNTEFFYEHELGSGLLYSAEAFPIDGSKDYDNEIAKEEAQRIKWDWSWQEPDHRDVILRHAKANGWIADVGRNKTEYTKDLNASTLFEPITTPDVVGDVPTGRVVSMVDVSESDVLEAVKRIKNLGETKLSPIPVVRRGDEFIALTDIDRATVRALALLGVGRIRVKILGKDSGQILDNSAYVVEEENNGSDEDGKLRTHKLGKLKGEAAREKAYKQAEENLPLLDNLVRTAARDIGAESIMRPPIKEGDKDADPREIGKAIKKRKRVNEKAEADYNGDYSRIVDLIGGTIALADDAEFGKAIQSVRDNLPKGASIAKIKKLNYAPGAVGYSDIKLSIRFANGGIGEIILVSAHTNEVKFHRGGHNIYDVARVLDKYRREDAYVNKIYTILSDLHEMVYSREAVDEEAFALAKSKASSSLQRLLEPDNASRLSSKDIKTLKSSESGLYLAMPPSVSSQAIPLSSLIVNINTSLVNKAMLTYRGKNVKDVNDAKRRTSVVSLGVPYQGSKGRFARDIVATLPEGKRFVDLFSGGGAVTHAAMLSGKYSTFHMNDKNPVGQRLFMEGLNGLWQGYNRSTMTPEEFYKIKGTPEAIIWSWNALGRTPMRNTGGIDYVGMRVNRVNRLAELGDEMAGRVTTSEQDYRSVARQCKCFFCKFS